MFYGVVPSRNKTQIHFHFKKDMIGTYLLINVICGAKGFECESSFFDITKQGSGYVGCTDSSSRPSDISVLRIGAAYYSK